MYLVSFGERSELGIWVSSFWMVSDAGSPQGPVMCGSWIRRPENLNLVVLGSSRRGNSCPSLLEIFSFDSKTTSLSTSPLTTYVLVAEEGDPDAIVVHPSGDDFVCALSNGSCNLDSEFLASTSTDGLARIWKIEDRFPLTTLSRKPDEKIELCLFSKDGTKPFLFCSVQKGETSVTAVYDISTWNKIGHKRLLRKSASVMSIGHDGKYLSLGSKDGDICVVEVKKMQIYHYSKRLHLGTNIASLEFCSRKRVVLTTSVEWGALIYLVLLGLFLASAVAVYIFFENSDSFWNFPMSKDQPRPRFKPVLRDSQPYDDQNIWGPVDM